MNRIPSAFQTVKKVPGWVILRLATVTDTNPGLWVVSALAALVGAVVAVLVVLMVYAGLDQSPVVSVPSESSDGCLGESVVHHPSSGVHHAENHRHHI